MGGYSYHVLEDAGFEITDEWRQWLDFEFDREGLTQDQVTRVCAMYVACNDRKRYTWRQRVGIAVFWLFGIT